MKNYILKILFIVAVTHFFSCENKEAGEKKLPFENKEEFEKTMILSHQEFLKIEKEKIANYTDSSGLTFRSSGTGLQYSIYKKTNGDSIRTGDVAIIQYVLKSLDGEVFYESPENRFQEFIVDYDDVESGLHEGIKKMKVGEKAMLVLPAHLAHGVTGDQAAIPAQTTLVYDLFLAGKK